MAQFYEPIGMNNSGKNFMPLNKHMESLFLSKIKNFIESGLSFIKDNCDFFHYDVENFVYKICYVSTRGNFCIIYITIFTENSLYYYEVNRKSGDAMACIEFMKFFETSTIPKKNEDSLIKEICKNDLDTTDTSDISDIVTSVNSMISSDFMDVKTQAMLTLYSLVKNNPNAFLDHVNFYTDLFQEEDDWENTFSLINVLTFINSDKENTKKQIRKCLKKLKDISISSNIRKNIVEKAINMFIDKKLEKYTYDKEFLEFVEKERDTAKNINIINSTRNIFEIIDIPKEFVHNI